MDINGELVQLWALLRDAKRKRCAMGFARARNLEGTKPDVTTVIQRHGGTDGHNNNGLERAKDTIGEKAKWGTDKHFQRR